MNIIFHIDVNNAFLSWTAVDMLRRGETLDIRTIPSIIGGDEKKRHGIVIAKSPVAKKYGVVTAEPIFMAKRKCPNLKVYEGDYRLYHRESNKLYNYFCNFTPDIERYSIDECFLDLSNTSLLYSDYIKLAEEMRSYINKNFGITVNIGISNNRLCAKMASDFEKPNKIHTLFPNEIESKMWPLPVGDLFMVGKKSTAILNQLGIFTIGDLAHSDINILSKYFKNNAANMINSANGIDNTKIEKYVAKEKSLSVSETFPVDIESSILLKEKLLFMSDRVGREARGQKLYAGVIAVIFKTGDFVSYSHQKKLVNPINSTEEIYKTACQIFDFAWKGEPIRLLGIRLTSLTGVKVRQYSLFETESDANVDKVQEVVDKINDKYGTKVMLASMKIKK